MNGTQEPGNYDEQEDHDLLVKLNTDMDWLRGKTQNLCKTVYDDHPKEHRRINEKIDVLEKKKVADEAVEKKDEKDHKWTITVVALIITAISCSITAYAVFGG